jgi:hypothetical protein
MKFPRWAITVTPLSKALAMFFFILFPFIGFYLGINYQRSVDKINSLHTFSQPSLNKEKNLMPVKVPGWKTFNNVKQKYIIQYPSDWEAVIDNSHKNAEWVKIEPIQTQYFYSYWDGVKIKNSTIINISMEQASSNYNCGGQSDGQVYVNGGYVTVKKEQVADGRIYNICAEMTKDNLAYIVDLTDKGYSKEPLFKQIVSTFEFYN